MTDWKHEAEQGRPVAPDAYLALEATVARQRERAENAEWKLEQSYKQRDEYADTIARQRQLAGAKCGKLVRTYPGSGHMAPCDLPEGHKQECTARDMGLLGGAVSDSEQAKRGWMGSLDHWIEEASFRDAQRFRSCRTYIAALHKQVEELRRALWEIGHHNADHQAWSARLARAALAASPSPDERPHLRKEDV